MQKIQSIAVTLAALAIVAVCADHLYGTIGARIAAQQAAVAAAAAERTTESQFVADCHHARQAGTIQAVGCETVPETAAERAADAVALRELIAETAKRVSAK